MTICSLCLFSAHLLDLSDSVSRLHLFVCSEDSYVLALGDSKNLFDCQLVVTLLEGFGLSAWFTLFLWFGFFVESGFWNFD